MAMKPVEWTESALIQRSADFRKLCALHKKDPAAASAKLEGIMRTVSTMLEQLGIAEMNNEQRADTITTALKRKFRAMHDREPGATEEAELIEPFAQIHALLRIAHTALQQQNGDKCTSDAKPEKPQADARPPAA